jgi:membrane associated rhomboid family serine protease
MVAALIVVNVVVYLYQRSHLAFEEKYALTPFYVHYGHRWYELITSAFLHENVTHILLNMVSLAIIGPAVEREMGRVRFLLLYMLAAVGGSIGYYLLAPLNQPAVGASGAIFGLLGAYFVIARMRGWPTQQVLALLVINLLYSFSGGIAWQAHLGGLVVGALGALGLMWAPRRAGRPSETAQLVQGLAVAVAGAVLLGVLAQLPPGHVSV